MDDSDRATHQEEMMRELALQRVISQPPRDYAGELCTGCDYATRSNFGPACEAWAECLADLQRRERAGR